MKIIAYILLACAAVICAIGLYGLIDEEKLKKRRIEMSTAIARKAKAERADRLRKEIEDEAAQEAEILLDQNQNEYGPKEKTE